CEDDYAFYAPMGCGNAWDDYVECTVNAPVDCEAGDYWGCDDEQDGYFECVSRFVQSTNCARLGVEQDYRCSEAAPYSFGCLGEPPQGCVPAADAETISCCPEFTKRFLN